MYRTIDTATWDDPWVTDLEPLDKLLFFYLLTNRRSTACGAFEITLKAIAFETGLDVAQVVAGLDRLAPKILWWPEHRVIFVRNFFKHQSGQSNVKNFTEAAAKKLRDFPQAVQDMVIGIYPALCKEDTHTHPIPIPPPSVGDKVTVTETVTVTEEKKSARAKAARSLPDDFTITDVMRLWAKKNTPGLDVLAATEEWKDAMRSNTTKYKYTDWEAAWHNGMKRALAWGAGGNGNGANRQGGPKLQTEESVRSFRPGLWEAAMEEPRRAAGEPE